MTRNSKPKTRNHGEPASSTLKTKTKITKQTHLETQLAPANQCLTPISIHLPKKRTHLAATSALGHRSSRLLIIAANCWVKKKIFTPLPKIRPKEGTVPTKFG
jgi:hypothetical protein